MLESTTVPLHQILTQKIIYMQNFASIFDFISIHCTNFQHTWFAPNFDSKIIYMQNFAPIFDIGLHQILTRKIIYMRNFAPIFDFFSIQWSFVGDTMTLEMVIRRWNGGV